MERVDGGEYRDFQYRLLVLLLVVSPFFVGPYLAVYQAMAGGMHGMYFWVMVLHMPLSWGLWGLLRGHPARMLPGAWAFELTTLNLCLMALCYGVADELRILWFYLNIPAVFIVFGIRIGWMLTLLDATLIVAANALSGAPYSALALVNGVSTALYLGVMFHILLWRTQLFYRRMQAHNQELKRLASHDALTGLMNAGAFHAACESIIRLSQRHRSPFAVLFIDLDHFKKVNDTHGHAVGDEVLRTAARTLRSGIRHSDVLGRIGGEEFCLLLPQTGAAGALKLAETLRQAVEACRPEAGGTVLQVTASVGVSACEAGRAAWPAIQKDADEAMYRAKQAGRNRVVLSLCGPAAP